MWSGLLGCQGEPQISRMDADGSDAEERPLGEGIIGQGSWGGGLGVRGNEWGAGKLMACW